MAFNISYTAQRKLIAGHTIGLPYNFDIDFTRFDEAPIPNSVSHSTLSGDIYSDLYNIEEVFNVTTELVPTVDAAGVDAADMKEFLYSVMNNESFAIDDGSFVFSCVLTGRVSIRRKGIHFQYSFKFKVIS